jgi:hypothetical protein
VYAITIDGRLAQIWDTDRGWSLDFPAEAAGSPTLRFQGSPAVFGRDLVGNKKSVYALTTDGRLAQMWDTDAGWSLDFPAEAAGSPSLRFQGSPGVFGRDQAGNKKSVYAITIEGRLAQMWDTDAGWSLDFPVTGSTPWVFILCHLADVPATPEDPTPAMFSDMLNSTGGIGDYWRDISMGSIDLTGSNVLGWYTMTSRNFAQHWGNSRTDFVEQAMATAAANGVPWTELNSYYGVVAVINAPVDGSATLAPRGLVYGLGPTPLGEDGWRWCNKCAALAYNGLATPLNCPVGGPDARHDHSGSDPYTVARESPAFPGESNWHRCDKCGGLVFGDSSSTFPCAAGGTHSTTGAYRMANYPNFPTNQSGQIGWRKCSRCGCLVYSGMAPGACAGVGTHDYSGSTEYSMMRTRNDLGHLQYVSHEMGHGYGLVHSRLIPAVDYGDRWCVMGSGWTFDDPSFGSAGSGLCSPALNYLGWVPSTRRWSDSAPGAHGTVVLAPLGLADKSQLLMASVVAGDRTYTVEFRDPTSVWDRGIPRPAVMIHELRPSDTTPYLIPPPGADGDHADWRPGQVFTDSVRGVSIRIRNIDTVMQTARVTINGDTGLLQLHEDGSIWQHVGSDWIALDNNPNTTSVVASPTTGGHAGVPARIYQTHRDGSIWQYVGPPMTGWVKLDDNGSVKAISASATSLYKLHTNGSIWKYTGTPMTGWLQLDNNTDTTAIAASAPDGLYQVHKNGSIWQYTGIPMMGWQQLDNNPGTRAIAVASLHLYQLRADASIWAFTGTAMSGWLQLDNNPDTVAIAADGESGLYQLRKDGAVWQYTGTPLSGWQQIDNNADTSAIVASHSGLYQLNKTTGTIWEYNGTPMTGWNGLDANPTTTALIAY